MIKVVTINISSDTEYWNRGRDLSVVGLREVNADIIGIQEIDEKKADFLLTNIDMPYIYRVNYVAILMSTKKFYLLTMHFGA
jgi:endonuclease/exonuclease/phosphatase family metal-dependent hydrolase